MKILLIEDEKRLSDSLKALLTAKGFQVEAVYDGETGADYALLPFEPVYFERGLLLESHIQPELSVRGDAVALRQDLGGGRKRWQCVHCDASGGIIYIFIMYKEGGCALLILICGMGNIAKKGRENVRATRTNI